MEFYFDIEFIKELQNKTDNSDFYIDFVRFLKQLHGSNIYVFIEPSNNNEDLLKNNLFLKYISDSRPFISRNHTELTSVIENKKTSGFKCFFINSLQSSNLRNEYGYFVLNSDEALNNSSLFDSGRQDLKKVTNERNGENYLNSWSVLKDYQFPINALVINDRYLFNSENTLDINILSLISNLGLKPLDNVKIDVAIITEEIFNLNQTDKNPTNEVLNKKFEIAFKVLAEHLNKLVGSENYNLSIIRVDRETNPKASQLHYRILFTNFFVINSEPSFSFFIRKNGNIIPRVKEDVNFDFLLWRRSIVSLEEKIKTIKEAFKNVNDQQNNNNIKLPPSFLKKRVLTNNRECRLLF